MGPLTESEARPALGALAPGRARFCFEYVNSIDAKSRVVLPAPFRPHFEGGGLLTVWQGRCLAAMPRDEWDAYVDRIVLALAASHEEHPDEVLREVWRSTVEVKLDVQGRLALDATLRNAVEIGSEVRFVGFGRRVELWPAATSAERHRDRDDHRATIALLQSSYDVPRLQG